MKYRVKVEGQWFEVEINDLTTQPVVAYVDGEPFEVWTESRSASTTQAERLPASSAKPPPPKLGTLASPAGKFSSNNLSSPGNSTNLKAVRAPIPGVIISIAVHPPAQVAVGEELCVLEAMKMRNSIRATRNGEIIKVNVTPGQHVRHALRCRTSRTNRSSAPNESSRTSCSASPSSRPAAAAPSTRSAAPGAR